MKKAVALLLIFFAIPIQCFSSVSNGTSGFLVSKTEHFDVIYRPQSVNTAGIVINGCEDLYENLCNLIGGEVNARIPIVITDTKNVLNANASLWPANHIVLIDTLSQVDDLATYKDGILGILRHELVHSVYFNIRSPFWKGVGRLIPGATPQVLYSTNEFTEGTAVFLESVDGYGRLNSKSYLSSIKQAKLEDKFPSKLKVSGVSDIYPNNTSYLFGGAFIKYLSDKYSFNAVKNFISSNGRLLPSLLSTNFKRNFGLGMKEAWTDFYNSIDVPDTLEPTIISKSMYKNLVCCNGKVYGYDSSNRCVFEFDANSLRKTISLYTVYPEIYVTEENSYLVSVVSENCCKVVECDKNGKSIRVYIGERAAVRSENLTITLSVKNRNANLTVWDSKNNTVNSFNLGYGVSASCFGSLSDGTITMLVRKNGKSGILLMNPSTLEVKIWWTSLELSSLTSCDDCLCFSYGNTFDCYGKIILDDMQSGEMWLSDVFVNGGIHFPVLQNGDVVFIGKFFSENGICVVKEEELGLKKKEKIFFEDYLDSEEDCSLDVVEKYKPLRYLKNGSILPFAFSSFDFDADRLGFGLSYITYDPTETWQFIASGGYDPVNNKGFGYLSVAETDFRLPVRLDVNYEYPKTKLEAKLSASKEYDVGNCEQVFSLFGAADYKLNNDENSWYCYAGSEYSDIRKNGLKITDYYGPTFDAQAIVVNKKFRALLSARYDIGKFIIPHSFLSTGFCIGWHQYFYGIVGIIPLCLEIQNGFLDLYFNRLLIELSYQYLHDFDECKNYNEFNAYIYFKLSPRIGMLSGNLYSNLGVKLTCDFDGNLTVKPLIQIRY